MNRPVLVLSLLCASAMSAPLGAAAPAPAERNVEIGGRELRLPDTPAGHLAEAYFKAYNSKDEKILGEFYQAHVPPAELERRPISARLEVARQMWSRSGRLSPRSVKESRADHLTLVASAEGGDWMEWSLDCEPTAPYRLLRMGVRQTDSPEESAGGLPFSEAQAIDSLRSLFDGLARADEFSGTVLLARDGLPVFTRAYGLADQRFGVPNRVNTKFNLGSINKSITKTAIGQLAGLGRLKLTDTLGQYFPDYPQAAARGATLQQLIEHRAGIGDLFGERYMSMDRSKLRKVSDFIPLFADLPLWFEPGKGQRYSNGSYVLLGAIVEKVSGQDYYEYVREHLYKPAGMDSTDSYGADDLIPDLAMGYTRATEAGEPAESGPRHENKFSHPWRASPAGGGYSTAPDLLRFTEALLAGKLLSPRYTEWMFGDRLPEKPTADFQARKIGWGIAGGSPGVNATLEIEGHYTLIVMSNYDPPSAESPARKARSWIHRVPS